MAPSQPSAPLDLALSWPVPERPKRASCRLGIASILSQPTSLLHGTGVRGWVGVNAFTQLNLSIKSNLPPPSDRALSSGHHEVCLARAKAGKEARQPHSEARVAPGSRCPDLIFHCSCSLKIWETRSAGPGQGDSMSSATDASACSPSSASGLHATCGWGIQ